MPTAASARIQPTRLRTVGRNIRLLTPNCQLPTSNSQISKTPVAPGFIASCWELVVGSWELTGRSVPRGPPRSQLPEALFVEQRDAVALFPQPFDLEQLDPAVPARRLERVGAAADDDRGPSGRSVVH